MKLPKVSEPVWIKNQAKSFREDSPDPNMDFDVLYAWISESLPKYLWTECRWKEILKPKGVNWQKFQRIMSKVNIVNWLRDKQSWDSLLKEINRLIFSPDSYWVGK